MNTGEQERFVQFLWPCDCGVELQVHGEYFVGFRGGGLHSVTCPNCGKRHDLPTRPLRFFARDQKFWEVIFLNTPSEGGT